LNVVVAIVECQTWSSIPTNVVDISAKGNELWAIDKNQWIWRWDGNMWQKMPGDATAVGASSDGWTWVASNTTAVGVYRWNVPLKNWDKMSGMLIQISAASKDVAIGVNFAQEIWFYKNGTWTQLPGKGVWAAIGDQDERWMVDSAGSSWRWNSTTNAWDQLGLSWMSTTSIDVQDPTHIIVANTRKQFFSWQNNNWRRIAGSGPRVKNNQTHYFMLDNAGQISISKIAIDLNPTCASNFNVQENMVATCTDVLGPAGLNVSKDECCTLCANRIANGVGSACLYESDTFMKTMYPTIPNLGTMCSVCQFAPTGPSNATGAYLYIPK